MSSRVSDIDAAREAAAARAREEAAERARQEAAERARREAEQQAQREAAQARRANENPPSPFSLFAERNGIDPTFSRDHFQFRFAGDTAAPNQTTPDPAAEADALIRRHTNGDGDVNTDALGQELAQTVVQDPARNRATHEAVIDRMSDGDRDEVAQSFTDAMSDEQLRQLATTPDGRSVLTKTEGALLSGSVHDDERDTANRIYTGLGQGLAQLATQNPAAARSAIETTMDGLSEDGRDEVAQVFTEALSDDQLGRLAATPDGQGALQRVKRELLAGDVHDDERRQGDRLQNAQVTQTFAQYLELRGDAPRELRGVDLVNEVGMAMNIMPNNPPQNADQEARMNAGTWEFYTGAERDAIRPVEEAIRNVGGENARVTALPVMLDSAETGLVQVPLFRVEGTDGREHFVDNIGRTYDSFNDWKDNNKLPAGRISYPPDGHLTAGAGGRPAIVTENSHAVKDTFWEHAKPWVDGAALVGGVVVAGALIVGTGGAATPFVIGAGAAISTYGAAQAGSELYDRASHGQSLSLADAEARSAWIGLGSNVVGVAALGASARLAAAGARGATVTSNAVNLARGLNIAAQYTDTAAIADLGYNLANNWERMTPQQRMMAVGQMAFWGGMMGHNVRQAGGVRNLYGAADFNNFVTQTRRQISDARLAREERLWSVGEPVEMTSAEANAPHIAAGRQPPYAEGSAARDIVLNRERVLVRVHGETNQARSWLMRPEDIQGLTAQQIMDKFALPELPQYVSDVYIPAGTRVRVGIVAEQPGWGRGGSIQYELQERLPAAAFRNRREIP